MLLDKLNSGLLSFRLCVKIVEVDSNRPPRVERLIRASKDKNGLCSIEIEFAKGRIMCLKQLEATDGAVWVETFPDPSDNDLVYSESGPSFRVFGFIPSHLD